MNSAADSRMAVRVALIGYGYAGRMFHAPLIRATPGLELVAVNSRDAAKVHGDLPRVVVVPSAADIFATSSVELVVVATPNDIVTQVAGGCGQGWHRGPYGGCRRNYANPAAHPCPRGWYLGPGGRCRAKLGSLKR